MIWIELERKSSTLPSPCPEANQRIAAVGMKVAKKVSTLRNRPPSSASAVTRTRNGTRRPTLSLISSSSPASTPPAAKRIGRAPGGSSCSTIRHQTRAIVTGTTAAGVRAATASASTAAAGSGKVLPAAQIRVAPSSTRPTTM